MQNQTEKAVKASSYRTRAEKLLEDCNFDKVDVIAKLLEIINNHYVRAVEKSKSVSKVTFG